MRPTAGGKKLLLWRNVQKSKCRYDAGMERLAITKGAEDAGWLAFSRVS